MDKIEIINLPKIEDPRGNLTFIEPGNHIPFQIKRVYWIYDVPGGQIREGYAYKEQQELVIALSGSFDVVTNDGETEQKFHLNRSYYGLYIPKKIWRHMENFSTNSVSLILSSSIYKEADYILEFKTFQKYLNL